MPPGGLQAYSLPQPWMCRAPKGRKVEMNRASKQVDVGRLKRNVRVWGWQPEPSMGDSGRGRAPRAALKEVT